MYLIVKFISRKSFYRDLGIWPSHATPSTYLYEKSVACLIMAPPRGSFPSLKAFSSGAKEQCDLMLKCSHSRFNFKVMFSRINKSYQIFELLLQENLLPRTFKNRPIRSHCKEESRRLLACMRQRKVLSTRT